jgi:hypothetical protein
MALLQGTSYAWGQLLFRPESFDAALDGVTAFSFSRNQEKENLYGIGVDPIARGYSNINYEGSITVNTETLRQLIDASPNGQIGDREREAWHITYLHPVQGRVITDVLYDVDFTDVPSAFAQNDKQFEHELAFIYSGVDYDVRVR